MDKHKAYIRPRVISNSRVLNIVLWCIRNQLLSYVKQCVAQTILIAVSTLTIYEPLRFQRAITTPLKSTKM